MRRAPFLVLVLPYAVELDGAVTFAIFRPGADDERGWHALTGDPARGEPPLDAARRISGAPADAAWLKLDSRATIELPAASCGVPEYAFAVRVTPDEIAPRPRLDCRWVPYEIADRLLRDESDRNALYELRRRLGRLAPCC